MGGEPSTAVRKALFVCIVVVLTGVGIYLTVSGFARGGDPSADRRPAEASGVAVAPPRPDGSATAVAPYARVALDFARAFTAGDRAQKRWHRDVARYTTPELAAGLAHTDPANVPEGVPTGETSLAARSDVAVTVGVPLDSGQRLQVTVVASGGDPVVSDVRPGR